MSTQGMVAVDHLLATLMSVTPAASASSTRSAAAVSSSTTAPEVTSLRRQAVRAAGLAETVRRQTIAIADGARQPADGESEAGSSGGGGGRKKATGSCFSWSDGVLVEALERGDWVVLDGANLCSAR